MQEKNSSANRSRKSSKNNEDNSSLISTNKLSENCKGTLRTQNERGDKSEDQILIDEGALRLINPSVDHILKQNVKGMKNLNLNLSKNSSEIRIGVINKHIINDEEDEEIDNKDVEDEDTGIEDDEDDESSTHDE